MPPIRARDLRQNIRDYGFEQGTVVTFEQLLDEYVQHRQHIRELTRLVSQCIEQIERFLAVGEGLRREIETIKRVGEQDGESPS